MAAAPDKFAFFLVAAHGDGVGNAGRPASLSLVLVVVCVSPVESVMWLLLVRVGGTEWAAGAVAAPFSRCGLPVLWLPPFALGLMVLRQTTLGVPGLVSVGGGVADAFFFSTPIATAKAQFISKTHRERRAKPLGREFPRSCFPEESSRRQCPGRQCRLQQESPRAPSLVRKSLLRINTIADVVHVILIYRLHNVGCEANVESVAEMAFERRGYEDLGPL
ncbi:hypothetical protein PF008_g15695 [Phytophthora fragariae]|uniref:Uncharacterized protein n=1 Tax=Phytophthora fragariae TaxID=53985 RepID=A0A6G0RE73_9STRA|nr:hypothetical protein PF008_g15695 [Phytophthora fragariae]